MKNEINIAEEFATLIATKVVDNLEKRGLVTAAPSQQKDERTEYPTLYTVDEVCQRLKLSKATLYCVFRRYPFSDSGDTRSLGC